MARSTRLTKRQKRILRQQGILDEGNNVSSKFRLIDLESNFYLTPIQKQVIDAYDNGDHLVLHGLAGTGKTFLSTYLALGEIQDQIYDKLFIVRSAVPTRDVGFLPGNAKQKVQVYEDPYRQICSELYGRGDAYEILTQKNYIEFLSTSFIRGTTFRNSIILVDEINNMSFHELDSVITRVGPNCRIILCGDYRQTDLKTNDEKAGLKQFLGILNTIESFTHFEFGIEDIVRSGIVKEYIIGKTNLGYV
jgi:phosphate starvation-inducible protein PhoH|tara:strand:- start:1 stop:747 length:747 start_codon:yes stop_codon:yes gene_type:complete